MHLIRYLLLIIIMMMISILLVTQKNICANSSDVFQNDLDKGAYDLETQINAFLKIGLAIQENSRYRQLLKVAGKPTSEMCIETNNVQKRLSMIILSHLFLTSIFHLASFAYQYKAAFG